MKRSPSPGYVAACEPAPVTVLVLKICFFALLLVAGAARPTARTASMTHPSAQERLRRLLA